MAKINKINYEVFDTFSESGKTGALAAVLNQLITEHNKKEEGRKTEFYHPELEKPKWVRKTQMGISPFCNLSNQRTQKRNTYNS